MVFYRKYRPQTIEDLDSKEVRDKLYSVLKSPSISHAFLFTGSKGLGKTSTARIVAKSLNCERLAPSKLASGSKNKKLNAKRYSLDAGIEPCNDCEQCLSITNGTNMDILEIDGASNRGIDEIRDLREKVKLSPLSAKVKVYIIDEVHMLTTEAFNALLKTLEEPPSHVVFILCTTEPHKVPPTILSRCLHIQFKKAEKEELVRSFQRILKAEKLKAESEALNLIAGLSDGSFRDGVKILEEMVLLSKDKKITKDLVEEKYQISSIQYQIAQMIRDLENKDTKSSLEGVSKLISEGIPIAHFMQVLIETLHNSLLLKLKVENSPLRQGFAVQTKLEIQDIKRLIELLSKAYAELKYAVLPQIPLELVIVEWGMQGSTHSLNDSLKPSGNTSIASENKSASPAANFYTPVSKEPVKSTSREESRPSEKITQQDISKYSENDALWQALIDKVKPYNHSVAGVLRGCSIKSYANNVLLIETNFKFHKERLDEIKTQEIIRKACNDITKKDIKISVSLKGGDRE